MIGKAEIAEMIPHGGAMCLLEEVRDWAPDFIQCVAISHREPTNPLAVEGRLNAVCGIEYAAQAMALHGRLTGVVGEKPRAGYLASVREVVCHVERLDTLPGDLIVEAKQMLGSEDRVIYGFCTALRGGPCSDGARRRGFAGMKRALVTGGSGAIGGAICMALGEAGYHVFVHASADLARAQIVANAIIEAGGSAGGRRVRRHRYHRRVSRHRKRAGGGADPGFGQQCGYSRRCGHAGYAPRSVEPRHRRFAEWIFQRYPAIADADDRYALGGGSLIFRRWRR